jgi:two-component system phosphate regulon sensor histidine kinase PhoR
MNVSWGPIVFIDIAGSVLVLIISFWCALLSRKLANDKPDDVFRNYIFLLTLTIVIFAISRSFGHLIKQLLLLNDRGDIWTQISPFSGAINSTTFVVIFAFGLYFHRFQKVHAEIEYYKNNLEEMISSRTDELEKSKNTLENILNNCNPINITGVNFDLLKANAAYYSLWPKVEDEPEIIKCYASRPGAHCNTADCPLRQILAGCEEVTNEVSKTIEGKVMDFIVTARPFRDVDGQLIGMVESFQDITLRKQAESSMRESEKRFRQIFESIPDPVILAQLVDGTIIDVNKAFEEATGISRFETVGRNSEELGFWADKGLREQFREKLQDCGELDNFEADFLVQKEEVRTGLLSARILSIRNEPCMLIVIRDITSEKAAERVLIEMDRMKSEFISTAAHELNTPLSAIIGYTEFLRNPEEFGGFSEAQKQDFINEIYDRGEALSRIIEDFLDISRIESGQPAPLHLRRHDIFDILRRMIKLFSTNDLHHTFRLDLPEEVVEAVLLIDRHRVNQALENLLSNAAKYSPQGKEIVVKGRAVKEGWEIRIKDQGIGMDPDQISRIFEKFYRADASDTAISGLGLGMSIVKQIIETHGGSIRVESDKGEGTTVIFTLPYGHP